MGLTKRNAQNKFGETQVDVNIEDFLNKFSSLLKPLNESEWLSLFHKLKQY